MKISKTRVYVADIYKAVNCQNTVAMNDEDTTFGFNQFDELLCDCNAVFIKVGCCYVQVKYFDRFFSYLEIMSHEAGKNQTTNLDHRFLDSQPNANGYFLKNIRPKFSEDGKIKISELQEVEANYTDISAETQALEPETERE